ncbi:hypothetical protein JJK96_09355 [Staphylococcus haemolyticus]|uniref:hypothetical protein n=1 Tax=Staphylococcus haemolyticus TaxID=1283 RepID=UPI00190D800E|nr:hypothetical protein [Staphylococcus haemolyticus]MBK3956280.1 hypothetical protein [Staphylococcus haemolyticus]
MNAEAKFVSSVMDARLKKAKRERNAYKKQRDELINDMAEVKRKAEAFDEILNVDYIVTPDDYAHEITKIVDKYREEQ